DVPDIHETAEGGEHTEEDLEDLLHRWASWNSRNESAALLRSPSFDRSSAIFPRLTAILRSASTETAGCNLSSRSLRSLSDREAGGCTESNVPWTDEAASSDSLRTIDRYGANTLCSADAVTARRAVSTADNASSAVDAALPS